MRNSNAFLWVAWQLLNSWHLVGKSKFGACAVTAPFYCFRYSNPYFARGLINPSLASSACCFLPGIKVFTMIKFLKSIYRCWSNPSPRKIYPPLLLHKAESSFTFSNKICTWYAFYRPKANLFCSKWPSSRVLHDCRSIFYLIVYSIHANCNNLIYCKNGLKRRNWTLRTIPFQRVLQKCSETSCTFVLPVLLYLYPIKT